MSESDSFAGGGYIQPTDAVSWWPDPPRYVPQGGMCWRRQDGSREWIVPLSPDIRQVEERN